MTSRGTQGKISENEALIESSFRRLLASIESEREKIRSTWNQIESESASTSAELDRLRQDTEEWCYGERQKIESEWKRLDKLRERMSVLWPETSEVLEVNCSGKIFQLPKTALCSIEGSFLNHMFSDAFVQSVPRDADGRYFLDFNPLCFAIIVDFLNSRRLRPDAPPPNIPPEQQQNMDLLVEALKLKAFMRENKIATTHSTSLRVLGNTVQSTHSGWQVISSQFPLPMSGVAYFEVKILTNPPGGKGGLAIGVCGHVPSGTEVHSIRIANTVLYNSHNGLVGQPIAVENVQKGVQLEEGHVLGVKHDINTRSLQWYHNRICIGACSLKVECLEKMRVLYPVFALYVPGQKISVDFSAPCPSNVPKGSVK